MKVKPTQSRGWVKGGTSSLFVCPLQGQGTASLAGLGATPQLLHRSAYSKGKIKPGSLAAGSEASLRSNFARPQTRPQAALSSPSHIVAPDGRDHIAAPTALERMNSHGIFAYPLPFPG